MLLVNHLTGFGVGGGGHVASGTAYMNEAIAELGLGTNCQLILDAANASSYGGSGQTFQDLSANATAINVGNTSGSEASDPTFNGVAGVRSNAQYFSVDGGDRFRFPSNPAWVQTLHKDNAVFTFVWWVYITNVTDCALFGNNRTTSSDIGVSVYTLTGGAVRFLQTKGDSVTATTVDSTGTVSTSAWHMIALSVDESLATSNALYIIDGSADALKNLSYPTPSASSASQVSEIFDVGGAALPAKSGARLAAMAAWTRALTSTELTNLFSAMRTRFGI